MARWLHYPFVWPARPARYAKKDGKNNPNTVTLIEMGDLHGTLVPHAAVLRDSNGDEHNATQAGGLAKLKKVVDDIRADNPDGTCCCPAVT